MDAPVKTDWCFFAEGFVGCHAQFRPYNATEDYMVEIFWILNVPVTDMLAFSLTVARDGAPRRAN